MTRRIGFNTAPEGQAPLPRERTVRWFVIGFLLLWLAGWTTGIGFALSGIVQTGDENLALSSFLLVWTIFAVAAWVFVVRMLIRLLRGQSLPEAEPD